MQLLPLRSQDRIVGHLANKIMGELLFRRGEPSRLDEEIQYFERP